MTLFDKQKMRHDLQSVLDDVNAADVSEERRDELAEKATTAFEECFQYLLPDSYMTSLREFLRIQHELAQTQSDEEVALTADFELVAIDEADLEPRTTPLCGCSSPTCALKDGEILPQIRDHSQGLLTSQEPHERVTTAIQSHEKPYVLQEFQDAWGAGFASARTDLTKATSLAATARARQL